MLLQEADSNLRHGICTMCPWHLASGAWNPSSSNCQGRNLSNDIVLAETLTVMIV